MAKPRIEDLDKNLKPKEVDAASAVKWISATSPKFEMRGLHWFAENKDTPPEACRYCRLPMRAQKPVREPVWYLAQSPSSANLAFRSDSTRIAVRVTNEDAVIMPHMPATGSNGLSLYCGEPHRMRPWGVGIPDLESPTFERQILEGLPPAMREYRLYLPLYKGLKSLDIGLSPGARILPPSSPAVTKPVVVYGTSITQGGCASTAGSDFVSTVGRMLNLHMVNLGFSGNGKGDPELADLMSEIDASAYVLDYAGNTTPQEWRATLPKFVARLRRDHPHTPILLVTCVTFAHLEFNADRLLSQETMRDFAFEFYAKQRKQGDSNLHIVDGWSLIPFGVDNAYVDGVHPADHGFNMMAERLAPRLAQLLLRNP